ncbi:MAG TPA: CPBP family intramembrane metalloprotease [Anaerolineae bacterium]|nr:CPBP family intramembrane metalloprotease [Anaerolineae bacterium]HMR64183.1 CPBP family intramembrane metalloprotease [Anaerolineae bacterium]
MEIRRIALFLALAFGLAWAASLVIYLTGGLQDSPVLIPNTPITLAFVLTTTLVMWAPALAHLLTRLLTGEGWQRVGLRPKFKRGWPYWLAAWFLPGLLTGLGLVIFFLIFPQSFDPSLTTLRELITAAAPEMALSESTLWLIVAAQVVQAMLIAPLINGVATFGEEFGWRAYLQPKLMPLGERKAIVVLGLIWGVWHWPLILMGHNYGLTYPGAPLLGPLAMVWFTVVLSVFLGWVTLKSGSVWPAVIGHGAINGIAGLGVLFVQGTPNPLLGPLPTGLIGGIGLTLFAAWLFFSSNKLTRVDEAGKVKEERYEAIS